MIWMHEDGKEIVPGIIMLDGALSAYECKTLISAAMEDEKGWYRGTLANPDENSNEPIFEEKWRKVRTKPLHIDFQADPIYYEVSRKIFQYGIEYSDGYGTHFNEMEIPELLHYTEGDFYKRHADAGAGGLMARSFSAILYLNDVEEGGETIFSNFDVSISPKEGRLVMFPSNFLYAHEAKPPVAGDKFAVVTWFRLH